MNNIEFKCSSTLVEMIENFGLIGIKTSFEDEGASFNEVIRLKEICNQSKVKLTLKIGGPEAIRDIKDSQIIGVKGIVAPMVESSFGLSKFSNAVYNNLTEDVIKSLQLNINIETINAVSNIDSILENENIKILNGITIGRVDLVSSMGKDRNYVNSDEIFNITTSIFQKAKSKKLKCCLGGAVSLESASFFESLYQDGLLDKFETRYAIFDPVIALKNLSKSLYFGQLFEYYWLENKKNFYGKLATQDQHRIEMIQNRLNKSVNYL